jgi:hypothetical protein
VVAVIDSAGYQRIDDADLKTRYETIAAQSNR